MPGLLDDGGRAMIVRTLGVAFLGLAAAAAHAEVTGRLQGLANDETGHPLPGVTVGIQLVGGSTDRSLATDAKGAFVVDLPPGRYRIAFRLPSFATDAHSTTSN
jgi:hypothetical protein